MNVTCEFRMDARLSPKSYAFFEGFIPVYSRVFREAWHHLAHEATPDKLTKELQKKHGIKSRVANSIVRTAKNRRKMFKEKMAYDLRQLKKKIRSMERNIKNLGRQLDKESVMAAENELTGPQLEKYRQKKQKICQRKRALKLKKDRLFSLQKKLREGRISVCFGTRKRFNAQFHLKESGYGSYADWYQDFVLYRDRNIVFLGRNDEYFGNQLCRLVREEGRWFLEIRSPYKNDDSIIREPVSITHKEGLELMERMQVFYQENGHKGKAMTMNVCRNRKGIYLHAGIELEDPAVTTDSAEGLIGVDCNYDHLAMVCTDKKGEPLFFRTMNYASRQKEGRSRNARKRSAKDEVRRAVKEICAIARKVNKDIVIEALDFNHKKSSLKKDKADSQYNRMLSTFAYASYTEAMERKALKEGVRLHKVDPAYTSAESREQLAPQYGVSVHEGAALAVARKYLKSEIHHNL